MSADKDYYGTLGVSPDADAPTIEDAYERLSRELQPDVNAEPTDPERMREIDEAFDVLDDPDKRAEYDRARTTGGDDSAPPAREASAATAAVAAEGADPAAVDPDSLSAGPTTEAVSTDTTEATATPGSKGAPIAAIALLAGGLIALLVAVIVLVLALTDDSNGEGTSEDTVTTESGLQYTDLVVGDGATPTDGQIATTHYVGSLDDGTIFDSSVGGAPLSYLVGANQLIPGWEEGVKGMAVGGERLLVIPPELGYGEQGSGQDIPPNATLTFSIRLMGLSDPPAKTPPEVTDEGTELEGGLRSIDIVEGSGDEAATGDSVAVHYTGWLEADGTRFDSSLIGRNGGLPQAFVLSVGAGDVIDGWDQGIPGMKEGGKRRLIVPPSLAYGAEGRPFPPVEGQPQIIPPNATLIFDIELIEVAE
jgi:peptidylprolyl isomerase